MRIWKHVVIIGVSAAVFYGVALLVMDRFDGNMSWYHYPFIAPVNVALYFGKGGEDMNAIAGNVFWALECITFGLLVDGVVVFARRILNRSSQD